MASKTTKHETLRSVALDVINNYQRAANSAAASVRAGSAKGISKADSTAGELLKYEEKISKKIRSSLETARGKIASAADSTDKAAGELGKKVKSTLTGTREKIVKATNKADEAVDKMLASVSKRVTEFPRKGTRMSQLLDNNVVESVKPLGIKGAKLVRYVSGTLADGVEKISSKVGGARKTAPIKKAAKTPTVKKAAKKVATAKKTKSTVRSKAPVRRAKGIGTTAASQ